MQAPLRARNDSDAAQMDTARTVAQKRDLADNRPEAVAQRELAEMMNNSQRVLQQRALSDAIHNSPRMVAQRHEINALFGGAVKPQGDSANPAYASPTQREEKTNNTGLPNQFESGIPPLLDGSRASHSDGADLPRGLRHGIEALSGLDMSAVRVHRNSSKPAQLNALAYAQDADIYVGPGQDHHLSHEVWHVVQQAQGRVKATVQTKMDGVVVNTEPMLEREADLMGQRALDDGSKPDVERVRGLAALPTSASNSSVVQGKFYYGGQSLTTEGALRVKLEAEGVVKKTYAGELAEKLWKVYGHDRAPHMEMGTVVKVAHAMAKEPIGNEMVEALVGNVKEVAPRDVNTPENFRKRIANDKRLNKKIRKNYLSAFQNRQNDPTRFATVKEQVASKRMLWVKGNIKEADDELKQGQYVTDNGNKDFRSTELYPRFKKQPYPQLFAKLERRVIAMGDKLTAAWYYNQNDDDKFGIFASGELQSYSTRVKRAGQAVESKSMEVDTQDNKTGHYFYSFIEHAESDFNKNTRFVKEATIDGALEAPANLKNARRLRVPLRKLVKGGAIIMGGDLVDDRQEKMKMGLDQNATQNKLFGPGGDEDKLAGILRNYVRFVEQRVYQAMPSYWNPFRSWTKGGRALAKLDTIDSMSDMQLWEYLVREIAQPQLLTPSIVSTSMKGMQKADSKGATVS